MRRPRKLERILADENVPRLAVEGLRAAGHDVSWTVEAGRGDDDVPRIKAAVAEDRVILTEDNDFARLAIGYGLNIRALIRFNLRGLGRIRKSQRIVDALGKIGEDVDGKVFVIEPMRVRVHSP